MIDARVVRTARSVFKYRMDGTLVSPGRGVWLPPTAAPAELAKDPWLCSLLVWLHANNGPDAEFWIAKGLHKILGWPRGPFLDARRAALEAGWIEQVTWPSRGVPARYRWGRASKRERSGREAAAQSRAGVYLGSGTESGTRYFVDGQADADTDAIWAPTPTVLTVPHLVRRNGYGLAFNLASPPAWVLPLRGFAAGRAGCRICGPYRGGQQHDLTAPVTPIAAVPPRSGTKRSSPDKPIYL
jgi:hypothetical protein